MEKPYRIEDEKDLADTRYRWQYRAGITAKHSSCAKIKKAVLRELAHAETAFISFMRLRSRVEIASKGNRSGNCADGNCVTVRNQPSVSDDRQGAFFGQDSLCQSCL